MLKGKITGSPWSELAADVDANAEWVTDTAAPTHETVHVQNKSMHTICSHGPLCVNVPIIPVQQQVIYVQCT